jgi:hypothetical protein
METSFHNTSLERVNGPEGTCNLGKLKIPASQFLTHFSIGYFGIRAYPWCVYQEPLFILQEGELEEKKDVGKS